MSKYLHLEVIEHSEQDIKDFNMENDMTTIIEIDRMVFSLNHNKVDKAEAQESLRNMVAEYIKNLALELKNL